MMPYHLVKDYNSKQLERLCGVSKTAAKYQMKIFREELSKRNRKLWVKSIIYISCVTTNNYEYNYILRGNIL